MMHRWARVSFPCCICYVLIVGGNVNHFSLVKLLIPIARLLMANDSVKISKRPKWYWMLWWNSKNEEPLSPQTDWSLAWLVSALRSLQLPCSDVAEMTRSVQLGKHLSPAFTHESLSLHTCQKHLSSGFTCPNGDLSGKHESLPVFVSHPAKS